jgi:hypothetical protein
MFGMLWINVYNSAFQFPPISNNFAHPLKGSGTIFHRPQSTAGSTLCEGNVSPCMRQMVVTPDTDSYWKKKDPLPYHFLKVSLTKKCISVFPVK